MKALPPPKREMVWTFHPQVCRYWHHYPGLWDFGPAISRTAGQKMMPDQRYNPKKVTLEMVLIIAP